MKHHTTLNNLITIRLSHKWAQGSDSPLTLVPEGSSSFRFVSTGRQRSHVLDRRRFPATAPHWTDDSFGHNFTRSLGGFHEAGRDLLKCLNPRSTLRSSPYNGIAPTGQHWERETVSSVAHCAKIKPTQKRGLAGV